MSERRVDLQTHSTFSDGTLPPERIVERAAEIGLAAVALTDHDTVDGLDAFHEAGEHADIETIAGIELSARVDRQDVDVLGYLIDPDDPQLASTIDTARAYRRQRLPSMLERLEDEGVPLDEEDVQAHAGEAAPGRPHVARALVEAGHVDTVDQAFDQLIGEGQPGYVPKQRLDPADAVEAIHSAGGVAVLAHPCLVHPGVFGRILEALVEVGLDGIEVWYSEHDATHERFFAEQAERHGLVKTGGSDFHGDNTPGIELGFGRGNLDVPYRAVERMRDHARSNLGV